MDTHVPDNTIVPPLSSRRPQVALPGEETELPADTLPELSEPETLPPRKSRRGALLGGVALTAVVLVAAGVFLVSPYNTILPIGVQGAVATARQGAQNTVRHAADAMRGLVAPAAQLATAPTPEAVPTPVREPPPHSTPEAQLGEILAYQQRQGTPSPSRPEAAPASERRPVPSTPLARRVGEAPVPSDQSAATPNPAVPEASLPQPAPLTPRAALPVVAQNTAPPPPQAETAALAAAPVAPLPPTPMAGAAAAHAPVAPVPLVVLPVSAPPSPAATPVDPVAIAANLRPASMTTQQQVEVLGLVTEMAVIMRNREERDRQLQADLAATKERLEAATADFGRRLSLAEARGAMNAAMGAVAPPAPAPVQTTAPQAATPVAVRAPASAAPATNDGVRRRYRVQAASPGLAMLSEVDRTGETGSQLQVAVGDDVPGYGKITAIAQQGSSWVVRAERGNIQ